MAVFSKEHGEEYYWHRPTNKTQWEKPELPASAQAAAEAAPTPAPAKVLEVTTPELKYFRSVKTLRSMLQDILHQSKAGDRLQGRDVELLKEVLTFHPHSADKVGKGVEGFKVDASLHEKGSNCFWVLRKDGSTEDFSMRKCMEVLEKTSHFMK